MLYLILGGARSGKSDFAERLAADSGRPVLYAATMEPGDEEMRDRIAKHRASRPASWRTVEAPRDLPRHLGAAAQAGDFVILDCVTLWLTNLLLDLLPDAEPPRADDVPAALDRIADEVTSLLGWVRLHSGDVAVVSNEVGMGLVPPYPLGRVFRDALGAANRRIATRADETYLLVAGLVLPLRALGAASIDHRDA
jgi:adenosylcobinamide kinase/adenosylcobinamide-phosphate guanylyltransferase